jgi:uncharacterized protein (DUF427 family)
MMTLSTAYEKHPQHRIEIDDEQVALRVSLNGEVLAETTRGLNLREGRYPAIVYVPRKDVNLERLEASDHTTHCPFKGDASYFDYLGNDQNVGAIERVAWSYETPFDQMAAIRGHLAFHSNLVTIEPLER